MVEEMLGRMRDCHSLSAILGAASAAAAGLFRADKTLAIVVQRSGEGEARLAYFYSFEDAHVYNFDYAGTFIESIVDSGNPLTFPEAEEEHLESDPAPKKAHSISEEEFGLIRYVPVKRDNEVFCVCEMCYADPSAATDPDLELVFSQMLGRELHRFSLRLQLFLKAIKDTVRDSDRRRTARAVQCWRKVCEDSRGSEEAQNVRAERSTVESKVLFAVS